MSNHLSRKKVNTKQIAKDRFLKVKYRNADNLFNRISK